MTRGSASFRRRATAAPPAPSSSYPMPPGAGRGYRRRLPGGGLAAMRDCMRVAGFWQLRRRVCQHRLVGLPRQGCRHRRGHVPRGVRDAGGVLPEGGKGARGGEAQRASVPGLSAAALEAPAHQQRARVRQQGNQVPLARGAGIPVGEFAAQARGSRHVRPGRDMSRLALFLGEEDDRDARRGAPEGRLGLS